MANTTDKDVVKIVARNIVNQLEKNNKTQLELAEYMGVTQAAVSNWCRGDKMPRMNKVDKICEFFGITRSQLMTSNDSQDAFYSGKRISGTTKELFDIALALKEEDINIIYSMAKRLANK